VQVCVCVFTCVFDKKKLTRRAGSPFILAFVIARVLAKMLHAQVGADLYMDAVVASVLCKFGFVPQYESDTKAVVHLAVLLAVLCVTASAAERRAPSAV
jgi:hypothetical protein